jgi:hypothetical protein
MRHSIGGVQIAGYNASNIRRPTESVTLRSMTNQAIMFRSMVSAGADDPDLERFVRALRRGPQTPEPDAACTGGVG